MSIDGTGAGRRRLGQALRELRHAADLTTTQLAERLGVAQSTISRWESGRQLLTPTQVDQWAAATGATAAQHTILDEVAEQVMTEAVAWGHRPRRLAALQRETGDLEDSARLLRTYHPVMVLGQVRDRYAYIVLDLAPSLSLVTLAALAAATDLVTPVNPERLAVNGLGTFLGWVDDFRREDVITAPLLGVLITKADLGADGQPRTRVGRESLEALQASGLPLFKTIVPRRVGVEDQVGDRLVVGDRGAAPAVFQAYEQFGARCSP